MMNLKQRFSFFLVSLAIFQLLGSFLHPVYAQGPIGDDGDPIPVILEPIPPIPTNPPRGPVVNPFSAELIGQTVVLECSAYCGDVSIQLFSTAGDSYMTVFHTENGSIDIPISGSPAYYQLILVNSSGQTYMGEFYL